MRLRVRWFALRLFSAVLLLAFALPGNAQDMAAREQQLRQRVETVYGLFVSGEFRSVEQYLTDDSKDIWFNSQKVKYDSFQIDSVQVAEDGLRADVAVMTTFRIAASPNAPFRLPQRSEWLYLNDQWFMKLQPAPTVADIFKPGAASAGAPGAGGEQSTPRVLEPPMRFEQNPVVIPPTERGAQTVVNIPFQNVTQEMGHVRGLGTNCTCLKAEVDKRNLEAGEQGTLTLTYTAPTRPPQKIIVFAILHPGTYLFDLPVTVAQKE